MKKLVLALSIFMLALSLSSCDLLGGLKEKFISDSTPKEQQEVAETPAPAPAPTPTPKEVRIYANAYDGFVNIRAQPSAKSAKLGRLNNGNDYLVKLGVQGKWTIVKWQNGIGYVNSTLVGYTPWKPVYLGVDGDWLEGVYADVLSGYLVFSNGKYARTSQYGDTEYGVWKLEGNDIVFITKYLTEYGKIIGEKVGSVSRFRVDVNNKMINHWEKCPFMSESEYACYEDCVANAYSKGAFKEVKKRVNKLVRLK